jgi:predicted component of type VI protein secretion system
MLHVQLKVVGGKHQGKVIPLATGKFLIGREQDCQLRANSELVSRHHCVFTIDDFTVRLRDLGSTNGTFVNGERLQGSTELSAGDRVQAGSLNFEILLRQIAQGEAATQTAPQAAEAAAPGTEPQVSDETVEIAGGDTSYEVPAQPAVPIPGDTASFQLAGEAPAGSVADAANAIEGDTAVVSQESIISGQTIEPGNGQQAAAPGSPETAAPQVPAQYPSEEAAFQPVPEAYPGQQAPYPQPPMAYPQQGMYPPPANGMYPQQPVMYPQHLAPYPQQPAFYPQQPMVGYPQPPGMPVQPGAYPPFPEEGNGDGQDATLPEPPVQLPDPSATGATDPVPEPEAKPTDPEAATDDATPSEKAADIIKQHMHRRPETT